MMPVPPINNTFTLNAFSLTLRVRPWRRPCSRRAVNDPSGGPSANRPAGGNLNRILSVGLNLGCCCHACLFFFEHPLSALHALRNHPFARCGRLESEPLYAQTAQDRAFDRREVRRVLPVEAHRLLERDRRVGNKASLAGVVLAGGVQHKRMDQSHIADLARQFDKLFAGVDEGVEGGFRRTAGQYALGVRRQQARHRADRIAGYERASALRGDVRPDHDGEQSLLRAVQEVAEEVPVLVPADGLGRRGLPRSIRALMEVDDQAVPPEAGRDPLLSSQQLACRLPRFRRDLLHRQAIQGGHVDDLLLPGGGIVRIVAQPPEGGCGPLFGERTGKAVVQDHMTALHEVLYLLLRQRRERGMAHSLTLLLQPSYSTVNPSDGTFQSSSL